MSATAPAIDKSGKKKKKSTDKGYSTYLHKVLKSVSPKGVTISAQGMDLLNSITEDLENRLANKSFELAKFQKKSTLSAKHVQAATKVIFPGEMGGLAITEGNKAVQKFTA